MIETPLTILAAVAFVAFIRIGPRVWAWRRARRARRAEEMLRKHRAIVKALGSLVRR
jgi:uncharacterized protein HemY